MKNPPASFKLLGHTIKVVLVEDLADREGALGQCHPDRLLIELQAPGKISQSLLVQTFLHEWVHMAFYMMGETKLYGNEKVVDLTSQCLYQMLVSRRGKAG